MQTRGDSGVGFLSLDPVAVSPAGGPGMTLSSGSAPDGLSRLSDRSGSAPALIWFAGGLENSRDAWTLPERSSAWWASTHGEGTSLTRNDQLRLTTQQLIGHFGREIAAFFDAGPDDLRK